MFILLAVFSMITYALQTALMASYFRRLDPLAVTAARGLSLGISMIPLMVFAMPGSIVKIFHHPFELVSASVLASLGNWAAGKSFRYLPV